MALLPYIFQRLNAYILPKFQKIFAVSLPERTDHRDGLVLASAVSNIHFEFVDGVHGDAVLDKALPLGEHSNLGASTIGSWRAHLNAIARLVIYLR